jgi:hypothetical protein
VYTFTIDSVPFQDFQNKPTKFDLPSEVVTKKADPPKSVEKKAAPAAAPQKEERRPSQVSSFDPFADSSSNTKSADAFGDFGGSSTAKPAAAAAPKPVEFDFFDTAPAPVSSAPAVSHSNDFFSSPAPAPAAAPSRPPASNDLFSDFSGLTFTPTASVMASPSTFVDPFAPAPAPQPQVNPFAVNSAASNPAPEPERKDKYSGLVDLNLKGSPAPNRPTNTQQSGPSLSMLTSNSSALPTSPAMVNRNSNAGFGSAPGGWAPQPPAPSFGGPPMASADPFASFASQPPRQSGGAFPGGNMGMGGPPMGTGMGGMGMGGPPMGMGMGGPPMGMGGPAMGQGMGGGMGMGGPGFGSNPYGTPGMAPQGNAAFGRPAAPNSLDNLSWK